MTSHGTSAQPQRTAHFSNGTGLAYRSGPPPEQRRAGFALL